MRSPIPALTLLLLAGCAGGMQTEFESAGMGLVPNGTDCVVRELQEEGYTVTQADDAGLVTAVRGATRLEVEVVPADAQRYLVRVNTDGSDIANETAGDLMEECAPG